MLIHTALRIRLLADAAVAALIDDRLYGVVAAQSTLYPATAYRLLQKEPVRSLNKRGHSGLCRYRFRFVTACDKASGGADGGYSTAKAVDEAIRLSLEGFQGTITNTNVSPAESVIVNSIFHRKSEDGYEDKSQTYHVITDYDVWAVEQKPE
jgi:hypothetical protein